MLILRQDELKCSRKCFDELWFKCENFPPERFSDCKVTKHPESLDLANDNSKDNDGIGHALNITDIWSVEVEQF